MTERYPTSDGPGPSGFREEAVELAALSWFELIGWRTAPGDYLAPDGPMADQFSLTMGQSPPGTYNERGEGLPFYQGRTDFGFRYPNRRVFCSEPTRVAEPGDTLVSVRAPVGDINMSMERCCLGRGVAPRRHLTEYAGGVCLRDRGHRARIPISAFSE